MSVTDDQVIRNFICVLRISVYYHKKRVWYALVCVYSYIAKLQKKQLMGCEAVLAAQHINIFYDDL